MKIKADAFNIVLIGKWNRHIFNPQWVAKELFKTDKIQIEYPINAVAAPRYTHNSIRCSLFGDRLVYTALAFTDEVLRSLQSLSQLTIKLLSHTPLLAFGVNFGFEENPICPENAKIFNLPDNISISSAGAEISYYQITRTAKFNDNQMTLILSNDGNKFDLDINYNYPVVNANSAIAQLDKINILSLRTEAFDFLKKIYNISID